MTEPHPAMRDRPTYEHEFDGIRYALTVPHPAAGKYPLLPPDELQELAADIAAHGLCEPVELLADGRILDGRNRELACFVAGVYSDYVTVDISASEIPGYVRRRNELRRHLTPKERRDLIADELRENPDRTDTEVARAAGSSDKTVARVRAGMEAVSEIPRQNERRGPDGKQYKAKKPRAKEPTAPSARPAAPGVPSGAFGPNDSAGAGGATADAAPDPTPADEPPLPPAEPPHPFADLMARVTALAADLTRAVRGEDEYGRKLESVFRECGLLDYPPVGKPRVLPLAGVHALLDLAGQPGVLPARNVRLVYDRANGSWLPPLTRRRRARKSGPGGPT